MLERSSSAAEFRLPGPSDRTAICGYTGSGKTRQAAWLLSMAPFDKLPYVVIDFKAEELFTQTDRLREIGFGEVPKKPGVYIIRPGPDDDDAVENWLRSVYDRGNCGLYVDEGYGIDRYSKSLRAILTQGRSLRLPVIWISQRPSQISSFVVSEATFLSVFKLTLPQDLDKMSEIMGKDNMRLSQSLPEFHSLWFDVPRHTARVMQPVPGDDEIINRLDMRLAPRRKAL